MKTLISLAISLFLAAPVTVPAQTVKVKKTVPESSFDQALYQYLIAEIAGQREQPNLAIQGMMKLASETRDPRIARRATELAFQNRQTDEAMEAVLLWLDLEPDSPSARQALAALANKQGTLTEATAQLKKMLADARKAPVLFMQMSVALGRFPDKSAVHSAVESLAKPYSALPEAHFAVAQAAYQAKQWQAALAAVAEAAQRKPGWQPAAMLQAQTLREISEMQAEKFLSEFLERYPEAAEVRILYARLLINQKSYLLAREQFRRAEKDRPDDVEIPYAISLIAQQIKDYADAEASLRRALVLKPSYSGLLLLNLGTVLEARKNGDDAIAILKQIVEGEYYVAAQAKIAGILLRQQGLEAGRKFLQEAQKDEDSPEIQMQLLLAEVQLLREAKAKEEAYRLLSTAIQKNPDTPELLYDRAMIAESLNKLDVLESDLRKVILLKPDHAHALNALGYTLADRTTRYAEAEDLIQRALKLAPDDAYIQDSLGWLKYKKGKKEEAIAILQAAYRIRSDPEIAAHLGEVLWAVGRREEATRLWRAALEEHPENEALLSTVKKYQP